MVPFGFHWVPQGPALRAITGVLFGAGIASFLLLSTNFIRRGEQRPTLYFVCVALAALALPIVAEFGGALGAWLIVATVTAGVLAMAGLVLLNLGLAAAGLTSIIRCRPAPAPASPPPRPMDAPTRTLP